MKRREIDRLLKKAGYYIESACGHDMAKHPDKPGKIPIPRHREIAEHTAQKILKAAGLK